MKAISIAISLVLIFSGSSLALMKPEEMRKFMDQTEKNLELTKVIKKIQSGDVSHRHLQMIFLVLQNTPEYYIHNMNGVKGNKVFVHEDGHSEVVYDKNGKLVQDGINDGSYNYFNRAMEPLKHFSFDTNPWIMWGSSPEDTTTIKERIFSFVSDIEIGIRKALEQQDILENMDSMQWDREGQIQALSIFVLAQEKGDSKPLHELFGKDASTIQDNDIFQVLKGIEIGLNKIY